MDKGINDFKVDNYLFQKLNKVEEKKDIIINPIVYKNDKYIKSQLDSKSNKNQINNITFYIEKNLNNLNVYNSSIISTSDNTETNNTYKKDTNKTNLDKENSIIIQNKYDSNKKLTIINVEDTSKINHTFSNYKLKDNYYKFSNLDNKQFNQTFYKFVSSMNKKKKNINLIGEEIEHKLQNTGYIVSKNTFKNSKIKLKRLSALKQSNIFNNKNIKNFESASVKSYKEDNSLNPRYIQNIYNKFNNIQNYKLFKRTRNIVSHSVKKTYSSQIILYDYENYNKQMAFKIFMDEDIGITEQVQQEMDINEHDDDYDSPDESIKHSLKKIYSDLLISIGMLKNKGLKSVLRNKCNFIPYETKNNFKTTLQTNKKHTNKFSRLIITKGDYDSNKCKANNNKRLSVSNNKLINECYKNMYSKDF